MERLPCAILVLCWFSSSVLADEKANAILLKPARVFDGVTPKPHEGWVVLVRGERIVSAGPLGDDDRLRTGGRIPPSLAQSAAAPIPGPPDGR